VQRTVSSTYSMHTRKIRTKVCRAPLGSPISCKHVRQKIRARCINIKGQNGRGSTNEISLKNQRSKSLYGNLGIFCWIVCFLFKPPRTLTSLPALVEKLNPLEYIHRDRVATPAVLPKVQHSPETLCVPTEVNTLRVDGLAHIPGLTQALYKSHPQPPNSVP